MKPPGSKGVAILVAGMHRSGTSALTRVLDIAGCDLPKTLMKPQPDNTEGFWESQRVMDLNQELLASAGSSWDDWRPFDQGWYTSPKADEFRERAVELVQSEFSSSRLFVLKDPRMCRLLKFWIEVVEDSGAQPFIISPIRSPFDVASSLHVRNDINPSVGYLIWLRHVLDAEAASRGLKRSYLRYEQLLWEAHALVNRIGEDLGLSWPKGSSPYAEMDIDEFLSPALHHHRSDDARHRSNPRLSDWVKLSFDIFDRWSHGEVREGDISKLDRIKAAFDEATPAFSRAMASTQRMERQNRILLKKVENARRELEERDGRIQALSDELTLHQREAEDTRRELEERDGRIQALSDELTLHQREAEDTRRDLEECDKRGHAMTLAYRRPRLGVDEAEVSILLMPRWLDQARQQCERGVVLELRCNGRIVARTSVVDGSRLPVRFPAAKLRIPVFGDALCSVHDAFTGVSLAALVTPSFRRAQRIVGAVENRDRPEVRGWVLDPNHPARGRRVAVYVNGELCEVIIANRWRGDVGRWKRTDGHHGFVWCIPQDIAAREGARIEVFDTDTGRALSGSPLRVEGGGVKRSGGVGS